MDVSMNEDTKLTPEENKMLKSEIKNAWDELPQELRDVILQTKRQKLQVLYMLQDWARKNDHETMLNLLSRKIAHIEEKMARMEEKNA